MRGMGGIMWRILRNYGSAKAGEGKAEGDLRSKFQIPDQKQKQRPKPKSKTDAKNFRLPKMWRAGEL